MGGIISRRLIRRYKVFAMKFSKLLSKVQEKPWYREFLDPVIHEINTGSRVLDIGTGPGKLLQILADENNAECVGVDTDEEMLQMAQKKLNGRNVELFKSIHGLQFPLDNNSFDFITFCSVLFLLPEDEVGKLLKDTLRLLKPGGKILVLTPTGHGNIFILTKYFFSLKNYSVFMWYTATSERGDRWCESRFLEQYARKHKIRYTRKIVMKEFALLETLHF